MKSEPRARSVPEAPPPESFRVFFELLPQPAALCDVGLRLLAANAAFRQFCVQHGVTVEGLTEALAGARGPEDGARCDVEVGLSGGHAVVLELSRWGDMVSAMARLGRELPESRREQSRTEGALLELGRGVAEASGEEELVAVVARGVRMLFPGRYFCIRIIDTRTGGLTSLYAEGRLKEGTPQPLVLTRGAVEKLHLPPEVLSTARVRVAGQAPLLFEGGTHAVSAPLVARGQLHGSIHLEYPDSLEGGVLRHDDRLLAQLANQVAVAVRNAKLLDELTFVRKYLEDLLEKANALIVVVNSEKQIVVFNQALCHLTGFSREEALGQHAFWLLAEEEHLRLLPLMMDVMAGKPIPNVEVRLRTRTGEVQASFATSTMFNPQGELEGVIAIGQDLTVVRELEQRVIQAEKMASLGQLAASVAHEINNPMTAVVTYADALLQRAVHREAEGASDAEKLRKILESGHRILRFTKDLLSYARPAKDRPEPVRLEVLLDRAVEYCEHVVAQAQVVVERDYGEVPALSAVRSNLEQVLVNLLTNACHAVRPGGRVWLRTWREGREAVVSVEDSGIGIAPEHLSRIFEPFFTTKAQGRGTGLGLSIVQRIVEKHGGWIEVRSALGQGTTFLVRLPLKESS